MTDIYTEPEPQPIAIPVYGSPVDVHIVPPPGDPGPSAGDVIPALLRGGTVTVTVTAGVTIRGAGPMRGYRTAPGRLTTRA